MDYINDSGECLVCGIFIGMIAVCGTLECAFDSEVFTIERIFTLIGWAI